MRITEGKFTDHLPHMQDVLRAHWAEAEGARALGEFSPDAATFAALEQAGALFTLLAFEGDTLIGYSINRVGKHIHYVDLTYSQNVGLYVDPSIRGQGLGSALIQATEAKAQDLGARVHMWHAKPGTALETLLLKAGHQVEEIVFSKDLA